MNSTENLIYAILLVLHNIALVILCGGLFYLWKMHRQREKYDQLLIKSLDQVIEESALQYLRYFMRSIIVLFISGSGFPIISLIYNGETKHLPVIAGRAFGIKTISVCVILAILLYWGIKLRPQMQNLFSELIKNKDADPLDIKLFFDLRNKRTKLLCFGFLLALLVLILTPFMRWGSF